MRSKAGLLPVIAAALVVSGLAPATSSAIDPEWRFERPSNSGIPGEDVFWVRHDPAGRPWVGARSPFWREGGIGIYNLPTAGLAEGVWETYANFETPIPSEYVNEVEFAPDGTVWMATGGGLVKKVGDTWTIYNSANSPLLHNSVRNIELDSEGHVWVNNSGVQQTSAALFEFDGTSWRSFAVPGELPWEAPWNQLSGLHVDANDHVWLGNNVLSGIAEYDGQTWTLHGAHLVKMKFITSDLDGNIWMVAGGTGYAFYKFDGTTFTTYSAANTPFVNTTIMTIGVDQNGDLYVGNWAGQVIKTTNGGASWSLFATDSSFVESISPHPTNDEIWVSTNGAVHRHAADGTTIEVFNSYNTGMPDFFVDNMQLDPNGNFWIATGEAGLSRFDGTRWRNWGNHNAGSEPYPFAGNEPMGGMFMDESGTVWMGGNGIARWDPQTGQFTGFWNWENNPGMGVTMFNYFGQDNNGKLFAVTEYGRVMSFDGDLWVTEPLPPPGFQAAFLQQDSQRNIYVAQFAQILKWDGLSWTVMADDWGLFEMSGVSSFAIGPDDTFWVGTHEGGLLRWDGVSLEAYTVDNSPLPARGVYGIDVRADGLLGVSTHEFGAVTPFPNGVALIDGDLSDPTSWSVFRYENSPLPHYQLDKCVFDANGDLWVSAMSEGVAVLEIGGATTALGDITDASPVAGTVLQRAFPNPFNPSTTIQYQVLSAVERVQLSIFDVSGRHVRSLFDGQLPIGRYTATWDGIDDAGGRASSGVYFSRLVVGIATSTIKLTLVE